MTTKNFNKRCEEISVLFNTEIDDIKSQLVPFAKKFDAINAPLAYANWCGMNFDRNTPYKRFTTFVEDFSIAEWFMPIKGIQPLKETFNTAINEWHDDYKYFAELVAVMQMKAWEHAARGNHKIGRLYSDLYIETKGLYFDWFDDQHKDHGDAMNWWYDNID